jgi:hypothetical protein
MQFIQAIFSFLASIFGGGDGTANPLSFLTTLLEQVFGGGAGA